MQRFWQLYGSRRQETVRISEIPDEMKLLPNTSASILYEKTSAELVHGKQIYVPILRYQGMSRGHFYEHPEKQTILQPISFCGTFFYYEAQSPAWLKTEHYCIAVNKVHAFKVLGISFENLFNKWERTFNIDMADLKEAITALLFIPEYDIPSQYVKPEIESGKRRIIPLQTKPTESARDLTLRLFRKIYDVDYPYKTFIGKLYSLEDYFDQLLCKAARKRNVDTVILTHMTGSERVVSEILETREREDLFNDMVINVGKY